MTKRYLHTTIKMSLASVITIVVAMALNLEYAITGGILAVLSIQLTRTDSYLTAMKRLISGIIALTISSGFFILLGYQVWVFALFTAVFIALSFGLKLSVGIVPSLVLVSHLLLYGEWRFPLVINGFLLIGIAIVVALLLNQLYPLKPRNILLSISDDIDRVIQEDLIAFSEALHTLDACSEWLEKHTLFKHNFESLINNAELVYKDILFDKDRLLITYIRMRRAQMHHLDRMFSLIKHSKMNHPYAHPIANYAFLLSKDIGHSDKASPQREQLHQLLDSFRKKPLPETRDAFEVRAILYQIIFELESFLDEKITFHQTADQHSRALF